MTDKSNVNFNTIMASSVHDMKNSLSIILDTAETLGHDDGLSKAQHQSLDLLHMEGERLNNTFLQLLALYRIENKQYSLNIDSHNVYDCLEEVMFENETQLAHHNIEIKIDCQPELEWFFDRALTLGIINTIINNALRHANSKIILSANDDNQELNISIVDDGPGYPDKLLNSDKAEQSELDFNSGNTGLGLHFAKVVAEMHIKGEQHGRIELSNDGINNGGKFSIYLP